MIGFLLKRPVAVIMSTIAFLVLGAVAMFQISGISTSGFIDAGCRYSRDQYTLYSG